MKKIIIIAIGILIQSSLIAQDEAIFTHYTFNPFIHNPAFTGISGNHMIAANLRSGYTGFQGTPRTYAISYNGPLSSHAGLGLLLLSENLNIFNRYRAQLDYGFNLKASQNLKIGIGVSTQFYFDRIDNNVYDNPLIEGGDAVIDDFLGGQNFFDASVGFLADYNKEFYVGVTLPNLVRSRLNDVVASQPLESMFLKNYLVMAGFRFKMEPYDVVIEPGVFLRKVYKSPRMADISMKAHFLQERITAGITYRAGTGGILGLIIGGKYNAFKAYYSFDVSFQRFQKYNNGSHELTLALELNRKSKTTTPDGSNTAMPMPEKK